MSDEAYSLVTALTSLAALAALFFRWRAHRALQRALKLLEKERAMKEVGTRDRSDTP
jgi:hypothetical protein